MSRCTTSSRPARSALFFDAIPEVGLTTGVIGLSIMLVVALLVGSCWRLGVRQAGGLRGADGPAKHSADVAVASAEKPSPRLRITPSGAGDGARLGWSQDTDRRASPARTPRR
ncbi:hypothetical protein QJS66_12225 [Kocuria rhizophila]|nr:hypothetical protein QJS66_12225 [Kocuria rhizophila]